MMKQLLAILLAAVLVWGLCACGTAPAAEASVQTEAVSELPSEAPEMPQQPAAASEEQTESAEAQAVEDTVIPHSDNDMFTDRDYEIGWSDPVTVELQQDTAKADGTGAIVSGNTVTINAAGSYVFTGALQGQVVVDAAETDKVQLVLDGAEIACERSAAIYIKNADKVFLTTARDSENTLSSAGEFVQADDNNVDGTVFAKADLTLNGAGNLTVESETGHGVVTKDDLKITSGTYAVTAADQGLSGKNSVRVAGGEITIDSGKDGIHSQHDEDAEKGFIYVIGGSFKITCGNDALDASGALTVEDGTFEITTDGGAENAPVHMEDRMGGPFPTGDTETDLDDLTSDSHKGLKAAAILVSGGSFQIDASDDAVHSNGTLDISGGSFEIRTGDDGLHADVSLTVSEGEIRIESSYEGIESETITLSGGIIDVTAADDAVNGSGGSPAVTVSGGEITLNSGGDSLDSNGDLYVSGGTITISGPENSGNGMLDCDGTNAVTGGTLLGAGASGMNQNFGGTSTQCSILTDLSARQTAGTTVTVTDSSGAEIASYTPEKDFQCVLISTPELSVGETYTITAGTETVTVELTDTIYGAGGGFGGGGRGRMF